MSKKMSVKQTNIVKWFSKIELTSDDFGMIFKEIQKSSQFQKMIGRMIPPNVLKKLAKAWYSNDDTPSYRIQKPKSQKTNYVGLEIECFTNYTPVEVQLFLIDNKLDNWVEVVDDGSIEPNTFHQYPVEFRILIPQTRLSQYLNKLGAFFKKYKFYVNSSCGLHVHLDMRNRNVDKCYTNLLNFQDLLFRLVAKSRQNNNYAEYVTLPKTGNRYLAINWISYARHKTLEVRLHQATLDVELIKNWVNLLLKIITYSGGSVQVNKLEKVVSWVGKNRQLKSYIQKTYDKKWYRGIEREHDVI